MFLSCPMMWTFVSTSCGRHFTCKLGHWRSTGNWFKYSVQCLVQQGIRVSRATVLWLLEEPRIVLNVTGKLDFFWDMIQGHVSLFNAELASTMDTCSDVSLRIFLVILSHNSTWR